jgi:hypothetical protein
VTLFVTVRELAVSQIAFDLLRLFAETGQFTGGTGGADVLAPVRKLVGEIVSLPIPRVPGLAPAAAERCC